MYSDKGEMISETVLLTPEFRVSFPYVFTGQERLNDKGEKSVKYSVCMLFKKGADLSLIQKIVLDVIVSKFGPDKAKWPALRLPFRDQADKAAKWKGYEPGAYYITATSNDRPGVVGPEPGPDGKPKRIVEPQHFYAGCYAVATINAFYYRTKGEGIGIGLRNIQKVREGDPLGNRTSPEMDFKPLASAPTSSGEQPFNPLAGNLKDLFGT